MTASPTRSCPRCSGLLYLDEGDRKCLTCGRVQVSAAELAAREYVLAEHARDAMSRRRLPRTPTMEASERVLSYRTSHNRGEMQ